MIAIIIIIGVIVIITLPHHHNWSHLSEIKACITYRFSTHGKGTQREIGDGTEGVEG